MFPFSPRKVKQPSGVLVVQCYDLLKQLGLVRRHSLSALYVCFEPLKLSVVCAGHLAQLRAQLLGSNGSERLSHHFWRCIAAYHSLAHPGGST